MQPGHRLRLAANVLNGSTRAGIVVASAGGARLRPAGGGLVANGMMFRATATAVRRPESVSHAPGTSERAGTEGLSRTSAAIRSTEKMIPASAAARGVLSGLLARSGSGTIGPSVIAAAPIRGWRLRHPLR
jgi:hypothetical protein